MLVKVIINGSEYYAIYNAQTDTYELSLSAPLIGGVYEVTAEATDVTGESDTETRLLRVLKKQVEELSNDETIVYFLAQEDLEIIDVLEFENYEFNIDEETNANTIFNTYRKVEVKNGDIAILKRKDKIDYIGIVEDTTNENGAAVQQVTLKYISNIFDRKVLLQDEELIATTGVEDFIAKTIYDQFTNSSDSLLNIDWLDVEVKTHTPLQKSVDNVENGIYNFHTYVTNCSQNYNIILDFKFDDNYNIKLEIYKQTQDEELIDTTVADISNYTEVYDTDVVAKVIVKTSTATHSWFLKSNRTITDNINDPDRARGKIEITYIENDDEAYQTALNIFKGNSYKHYINFKIRRSSELFNVESLRIGTPLQVRTDNNIILDTYVSAIRDDGGEFLDITCGNMRINFIDKIKQERNKEE